MRKRTTIGQSPLDAVVPPREGTAAPVATVPRPVGKQRLTVHLPVDLIDRLKNAVYWTPGLTLAGLAEAALGRAVDELEAARGEPFAPRHSELRGGRPVK